MQTKKAIKKFPDFNVEEYFYKEYSDFVKNHSEKSSARHTKRMKLFADETSQIKPRIVSKKHITAMDMMQHELGEYSSVMKKLRSGAKLNPKEEKFYNFIISAMKKTKKPQTLWRSIAPYDGFAEQIRNGVLDMNGFSSTARQYDDFFAFWEKPTFKIVPDGANFKERYMLKINIKKGTPILDCNAIYKPIFGKTHQTRMADEIILPQGKGIVKNIDKDLRIIEIDFCPN